MLPRGHRQESLSKAYVRAIAAKAGLICIEWDYDYGTDLSLRSIQKAEGGFSDPALQIDLQIKSTTRASITKDAIAYDLPVKNYNDLRQSRDSIACFLIVLILPDDEDRWLTQTVDELILRHCAYWLSLEGYPATKAVRTIRVKIPRENVFSEGAAQTMVRQLMERKRP